MKSPAPLLSLNPSGTFANLITASIWKGRNYIRQRVDPSNPRTFGQMAARAIFGSIAKAARAVLTSFSDVVLTGSQFFQDARDLAPSGQSWISFLQQHGKDIYDKTNVHWELLDATEQGYFTTEAAAIGLSDYSAAIFTEGITLLSAGKQLMALGFFGKDYLGNAIAAAAVNDVSPSAGEVTALAEYVNTSTAA